MTHFIQGDAAAMGLRDGSVHCIVTSPPYWGLRDYGIKPREWPAFDYAPMAGLPPVAVPAMSCPFGLEPDLNSFIGHAVLVFREVRRVLRDDATCWVNMGDSFAATKMKDGYSGNGSDLGWKNAQSNLAPGGFKPKDLLLQPHRMALALQADGWFLRMDHVWAKRNPMPESVTDRATKSHEYIFLLAKRERYYYDAEAVREAGKPESARRYQSKFTGRPELIMPDGKSQGTAMKGDREWSGSRNLRSVWTLSTRSCKAAHFATFPVEIPLTCIKAGTSERGVCPACGGPWRRVVEKYQTFESGSGRSGNMPVGKNGAGMQGGGETGDVRRGPTLHTKTTHWLPTCKCPAHTPIPATVLDMFGGAATTALAARELGRTCIIVERKAEYLAIGRERVAAWRPKTAKKPRRARERTEQPQLFEVA